MSLTLPLTVATIWGTHYGDTCLQPSAPDPKENEGNMIPSLVTLDSSIPFLREGYSFISSRCDKLGTDAFRTRIAGRQVICMRGAEAAALLYTSGQFTRQGALPPNTLRLLQDKGSVQMLDDGHHRHRKAMFMDLMSEDSVSRLKDIFEGAWLDRAQEWQEPVILHDEVRLILTRAACQWAGVPVSDRGAETLARELSRMIDKAASLGPGNWWAQLRRNRTEKWATELVERIRSGTVKTPAGCPASQIAGHRDVDGDLLTAKVAAVELINLLRPTVAVGRFIVFAALALAEYPRWRSKIVSSGPDELEAFAQEVRRFYPFFPAVGGVAREEAVWRDNRLPAGTWVLFDLYGTNRDGRVWADPHAFTPDRFRNQEITPHALVPQGAGDAGSTHRCPGERITLELVKAAALLLSTTDCHVPVQDLGISLRRIPALPGSGFVLMPRAPLRAG
ncbi:fatty-acid peroxygenase [Arthrobacter crystallopoietes]|uniref:Fatty-acid peroxygenase n=2 Tax=Crystallibacter crystallopoietes TaxID=37928 RepID=A0A1H1FZ37_9MICC|nr:fatty-acid peroxygenase [Arthrobacter crystallopoietes]